MTAIREAFARAGVRDDPDVRLADIAIKAMVAHANDTDATIAAIQREVQEDRTLMAALFRLEWHRAISGLLHRVRSDLAFHGAKGDLKRPIERKAAAIVAEMRRAEADAESERRRQERAEQAKADQEYREYLASWHATPIGTLEIDGMPVWQVTPATVRAWLPTQRRRWRTVELLIEGLPDDGRPIEYYRRPEDVADLWHRAGA